MAKKKKKKVGKITRIDKDGNAVKEFKKKPKEQTGDFFQREAARIAKRDTRAPLPQSLTEAEALKTTGVEQGTGRAALADIDVDLIGESDLEPPKTKNLRRKIKRKKKKARK